MSPRRILIALALALCVSGAATWLVSRRMALAARKAPDTLYAAPARAVQAGEVLKPEDVQLVAWPGGAPIDGAYVRAADVVGREALFPLAKGQPLIDPDLSAPGSGTGLASKVPDGMRAVALRSNEVVGVAGFLIPGSHLDVLVTYRSEKSPDPLTATVLQNAMAIAVGHQIQPDPQGKPSDVTIVTLLLTPEEAERAVLASTQGAIHFILRNGSDTARNAPPPLLLSELATGPLPAPHAAARAAVHTPAPAPKPREPEIEIVLGGGK
jgi:pilus assembly protein CpaB